MAKQSVGAAIALIVISIAVSSESGQSLDEIKRMPLLYPKPAATSEVKKDRAYRDAPALQPGSGCAENAALSGSRNRVPLDESHRRES